jgi:HEAT repeat protein
LLCERAVTDQHWTVRRAAVQALASGWRDDPDTLPWLRERATTDPDEAIRQAAVRALAVGWRGDPDALRCLRDYEI